jgi:putative heme-binding domain-containing protein
MFLHCQTQHDEDLLPNESPDSQPRLKGRNAIGAGSAPIRSSSVGFFSGFGFRIASLLLLIAFCFSSVSSAQDRRSELTLDGIGPRLPWSTSRMAGSPDPPLPYQARRVFPKLNFREPVELCPAPGSGRLFLLELRGKVFSFRDEPGVPAADLALDLRKEIPGFKEAYGMTAHPGFATNRFLYICYVLQDGLPEGSRVSRFTVPQTEPPVIDPATEKIIITWRSGGHNGGSLAFGPDSYLYISTGDGAGPNPPDPLDAGQDLSNLLSCILRIDVDGATEGKGYRVPPDNPFVELPAARPEIWAYGFRNPWKMSIDWETGDLWAGDVGWELWEMIYKIERGGNYGWSIVEGRQSVHPERRRGPTPILPPTVDHPHTEAASITGGFVYRGKRLPELRGAYIYGDYETGKIWALRHDGKQVQSLQELVDTPLNIVGFALDTAGELYFVDHGAGTIHELEPNPARDTVGQFPRRLSETGLFSSAPDHVPAAGVIPYSIHAERWHDGATAERFVALPGTNSISVEKRVWQFPSNAVFAKTLSLKTHPASPPRRIETQVLHFHGGQWNAYSYRWDETQSDALLVESEGAIDAFEVQDADAPGGTRRQRWRFHSRAECLRCHNPWSGPPLAFNLLQLSKEHVYPAPEGASLHAHAAEERPLPQLAALSRMGIFGGSLVATQSLVNPFNEAADLNARARSWLHANCAHCHRLHAGGSVLSQMNYDLRLDRAHLIGARPSQGTFGLPDARVIAPGDPLRSVLYYRASKLGQGRMPQLGSDTVDERGLELLFRWISRLPIENPPAVGEQSVKQTEIITDHLRTLAGAQTLSDSVTRALDQLLSSTTGALALTRELRLKTVSPPVRDEILQRATQETNPLIRDLFETFFPERLCAAPGAAPVGPEEILALNGNAARGEEIFFMETAQCSNCHLVKGQGRSFGPDLTRIGQQLSRAQLLESLLEPSRQIAREYATYYVETRDDEVVSGFLVRKDEREIVLRDANQELIRIGAGNVVRFESSPVSSMPDGLLQNLGAQQIADLLEFLAGLR